MKVTTVPVKVDGGALAVSLRASQFPQSVVGVLWRYASDQAPDGKAGEFSSRVSTVPIGNAVANDGRYFLLEGAVLNQNDQPPTPYQVVVAVSQGEAVIHEEVPANGSGQIGTQDVPFVYRFVLEAK